MERKPLKRFVGLIATALVALVLVGCKGTDGRNGTDGTAGTPGIDGTTPTPTLAAVAMTDDQWVNLKPTINVIGTPTLAATGPLSVTFEVKDAAGNRLTGLDTWTSLSTSKNTRVTPNNYALYPSYSNLAFSLVKLVPEDAVTKAPSKWVNYFITTIPAKLALADTTATAAATLTRPSTDNAGTMVQNANGTYTYTFRRDFASILATYTGFSDAAPSLKADLGSTTDLTYDATKIHRLVIQFNGSKRNTGSNTANGTTTTTAVAMANPINAIFDWIPSTGAVVASTAAGQREVTSTAKCNECHDAIGTTTPHGGRVDTRYCVACHNDQRKFGYANATAGTTTTYTGTTNKFAIDATTTTAAGDMPVMIHKMHMGEELSKTGYNYANDAAGQFNSKVYPMLGGGVTMCSKCHSGPTATTTTPVDVSPTAQGENWNTKPSRKACGACHDGIDWTAPHPASATAAQTNDAACAGCHVDPTGVAAVDIKVAHYTANVNLTTHNPTVKAGLVNFKYEISSVTQAVSGGPVTIKFRILSDGGVAGASITTPVVFKAAAAGLTAPLTGFTGSPAFLMAWAMPQAGEATLAAEVADYNNIGAKQVVTTTGATGVTAGTALRNNQPATFSIANLLNTDLATQVGTLSAPATDGTYTATVVGANAIFPAGAKLRTVALQAYFTQTTPAAARHTVAAYAYVDARRKVVDSDKCSNCHEWFEGHGGNRVKDVQVCVVCHVPGLTTSGRGMSDANLSAVYSTFTDEQKATLTTWTGISFATNPVAAGNTNVALKLPQVTNNMKDMIHGIHAGKTRTTDPFRIFRDRTTSVNIIDAGTFTFPGILRNCQDCHTYNGYSPNGTTSIPNGTLNSSSKKAYALASRDEARSDATLTGNATTAAANAALAQDNIDDLMTTPFTASCVSCHDSVPAAAHMKLNGGQIRVARNPADATKPRLNTAGESCAICHGAGSTYDPLVVHK